jgi:hypothetical protein
MYTTPKELTTVTKTSKTVAVILFFTLPVIAFYLGWQYGTVSALIVAPAPLVTAPSIAPATSTIEAPNFPPPTTPTPITSELPVITPPSNTVSCGVTNCHGTTVTCGDVSDPIACTMEYRIGDFCRQYVSCEVVQNSCTAVTDSKYNQCVSCIEKCTSENPDDAFMCEDSCRASLE